MNTSADTTCIRTSVNQQHIRQKICLKTYDEFLMNTESSQESAQCEVRRRISQHNQKCAEGFLKIEESHRPGFVDCARIRRNFKTGINVQSTRSADQPAKPFSVA